ncbi:uncharacterized protein LOC105249487 isoform X2 [Camponotus floridanus]|uniref:uncharacterized protein LOC105249487 isoform X2 n=1 Tax=Camponotus floridanus TaxID=104421 RepID=UPI000DC67771|nr:uncharacterized protein LOC105249487 isoform X2 [Camponotus floridanus]
MKKAERIDLSSSEDEICSNNLKEAIDQQFLNDNLYITRKTEFAPESNLETNKSHGKSFRISSKQDQFTNFGVTDTFQNFIAKKLDEILEKTIKLKNSKSTECFMQQKQKRNKNSGIKLLSTSKEFVTTKEISKLFAKDKKKLKRCSQITEDSTLSKFQEAAIDPECILSKSDMIVWNSEYSKPEFQYKKSKDDILIEV